MLKGFQILLGHRTIMGGFRMEAPFGINHYLYSARHEGLCCKGRVFDVYEEDRSQIIKIT